VTERVQGFGLNLLLITIIAVFGSVGLITYLVLSKSERSYQYIDQTLLIVLLMSKEFILLLFLVWQVATLNDEADGIIPFLVIETWGAPGTTRESERLDLLLLATTYALHPNAERSLHDYLTVPPIRPISISLAGVRPTKSYLFLSIFGLIASFVVFSVHSVVHSFIEGKLRGDGEGGQGN